MEQVIPINFAKGVDLKTDPNQVSLGNFLALKNSVFTKTGLLAKRPGYEALTPLSSASYLTTLNSTLIGIGAELSTYSTATSTWETKGQTQPCLVNTLPLVRNNLNQTSCDSVIATNGLVCTVYSELNNSTTTYKYVIADSVTGQNIVPPTVLAGAVGSPRVFLLNQLFIIVYTTHPSAYALVYISVSSENPTIATTPVQMVGSYTNSTGLNWDGASYDGLLYIAYATAADSGSIQGFTLNSSLVQSANYVLASAANCSLVSMCLDTSTPGYVYGYVSYYYSSNAYTLVFANTGGALTVYMSAQNISTFLTITNITGTAQGGVGTIYTEIANNYSYDSGVPSNYIQAVTVTAATSTVGSPIISLRSVGLASKAALINGTSYYLAAYSSAYQPSYFLVNGNLSGASNPNIVAKLAYQNGGGYLPTGLPSALSQNGTISIAYLYTDLVEALATTNTPTQDSTGGIYSQKGVNLVTFTPNTEVIDTAEIAQNLWMSGGYLTQFDGYSAVENNFFLFPDSVEVSASATSGSMAADQYWYQVTYEWTDNQGYVYRSAPSLPVSVTLTSDTSVLVNIPMLRLTLKTANPVKIVIYRYSLNSGAYNQVTSITAPILNDTTTDSYAYTDTLADSSVIGNNILYTTGGVVPDTNGPACNGIMTLFDTRLWMADAEDPNLLWVSKQVIEGTTVEMSSLFTIYVAPNTGTVSSTGPIAALAPMDNYLIIFKKDSIFYISGTGPDNLGTTSQGCALGNYSQATFITSVVGSINQASIVLTQDGLMFQSDKGIWMLQRGSLQTSYIGAPVEGFNGSTVTSAQVIPGTNYVLFTLNTGEMLMWDYYQRQWGTFEGAPAVSSCLFQDQHTILDPYGNVLQATPGAYLDNGNPVLMSLTTSWLNLAGLQGYQRFKEFSLLATFYSPHLLLCQVAYDYNPAILSSTLIKPTAYSSPVPSPFGSPTPYGGPSAREEYRVHSKKQLCESFQLTLTEVSDPNNYVSGPGLTISGLSLTVEMIKNRRPFSAATAVGVS